MSCVTANDLQLARLADAIAQRVGQQRFHVWFNNSTRLDLRQDGLEIAVPNDFISEWIGRNFTRPIQEATTEVLGTALPLRFSVVPELFEIGADADKAPAGSVPRNGKSAADPVVPAITPPPFGDGSASTTSRAIPILAEPARGPAPLASSAGFSSKSRLRHSVDTFIVGSGNQLAYNTALYVAEFPGAQYNPLFIHGSCGLARHICSRVFARSSSPIIRPKNGCI